MRGHALKATGTENEIDLIAAILKASGNQVVQMINYASPGDLVDQISLEDMWWLAVGNYHTGSGCIAFSLSNVSEAYDIITWGNVAQNLTPACRTGMDYVNGVLDLARSK